MEAAQDIPQTCPQRSAATAERELAACLRLLRDLSEEDWARPTDCLGWDVRAVVAHLVGSAEEIVRLPVFIRHQWQARRHYRHLTRLDAMNAVQVAERAGRTATQLLTEYEILAPASIRAQTRLPAPLRAVPVAWAYPGSLPTKYRFGYLCDVLGPRDRWMHRIDIARATNRPVELGPHDSEIVRQVVKDLADRWSGPSFVLVLDGAAGGEWRIGSDNTTGVARADAVECLRSLSGRPATAPDVEGSADLADALAAARVEF